MAQLSTKLPWELAQTKWAATLNPVIALPILNGVLLTDIVLAANEPLAINHMLQRKQQGWMITDLTSNAAVWRTVAFNALTLTLEASANVTISIWVF